MRFDGYGATIRTVEPRFIMECLADTLHCAPGPGPRMKRYGVTTGFQVGQRTAAWVGIDRASGDIYVEAKGDTTPGVVDAIRSHFPGHQAPRLDVCEDYTADGAFERLQALVRSHKGPRVKGGYVALPDDDNDGRTWAAGVRGGVGYIRVYEPGKMKDRPGYALNAARIELEARPHYARDKVAAAKMLPSQVWGLAAWTHRVGEAVTRCDLPRFLAPSRQYSHDATTRYIALTFRRWWQENLDAGVDITRTIQDVWSEEDALIKGMQ